MVSSIYPVFSLETIPLGNQIADRGKFLSTEIVHITKEEKIDLNTAILQTLMNRSTAAKKQKDK